MLEVLPKIAKMQASYAPGNFERAMRTYGGLNALIGRY